MGRSNLSRELEFTLKHWLRWSASVRKRAVGSFDSLTKQFSQAQDERYQVLASSYELGTWPELCSARELRGNLHMLDLLDRALGTERPRGPSLDVGSLNWWYLPAQAAAVPGPWDGVEIDAHQRYASLTTRRGHAEWLCRHHQEARYHAGCLTDMSGPYGFVCWFLPYVVPSPLVSAGLPDRFFEPERLLGHAWSVLEPGGRLLIVNQSARESEAQAELFDHLDIDGHDLGPTPSVFATEGDDERHSWLATKPV